MTDNVSTAGHGVMTGSFSMKIASGSSKRGCASVLSVAEPIFDVKVKDESLLKLGIVVLRPLRVNVPLRKSREAPVCLRNVFPRMSPIFKFGSTSAWIFQCLWGKASSFNLNLTILERITCRPSANVTGTLCCST